MRIAIIGAGAWGTALATVCGARHDVALYARDAKQAMEIQARRENRRYLAGIGISGSVRCVAQLEDALDGADLVAVATPVAALRSSCRALGAAGVKALVWLCKGFEEESGLLPHQVVAEVLPGVSGAILSGPSFALEVARGLPTALTVASSDVGLSDRVVDAFHAAALRIYRSDDVLGVEVGGAVKNVMAIATGIADGLALGQNARAALMTRGLSEMVRLGTALRAQPETLMGLTGVGDLILTCTGTLSRNRRVGLALGQGQSLPSVLAALGHVAEGVHCARSVQRIARAQDIEMPITDAVCAVMFEGMAPLQAVSMLLARAPRSEY